MFMREPKVSMRTENMTLEDERETMQQPLQETRQKERSGDVLYEYISRITAPDQTAMAQAKERWNQVAKPLNSLGLLEDAVVKIAGITGDSHVNIEKKALIIMCADNGVVEEGVSQTGQEVTAVVTENFTKGDSCVCIMAKRAGVDVFPVDIGVAGNLEHCGEEYPLLKNKIMPGTKNFKREPAMSRQEATDAILTGIRLVEELKSKGYQLIATGEMGIGNTTTSSAVASILTGFPVTSMTGKGAGLSDAGLELKIRVIEEAIRKYWPDGVYIDGACQDEAVQVGVCPDKACQIGACPAEDGQAGVCPAGAAPDVLEVLSKVGGLDLAGLTGVFLGGAICHIPIVIDGFISSTAALAAARLCPAASGFMLASHVSAEPAGGRILEQLQLSPMLTAHMCLGEGTGAIAVMPLLDMAADIYHKMSTFQEIQIEEYKPL